MIFINDLKERFIIARWCYLMGEKYLSDIEYDKLEQEFRAKYPNDEYSNRSWSFDPCPVELLHKYNRSDLICEVVMGYMGESIPSINTVEDYNSRFRSLNKRSRLSYKIDGWNVRVSYFNGNMVQIRTRGRADNNSNMVFNNIASLFPKTIPYMGRVAVTGELSIPNDKWKIYKEITGNVDQRASVRTALARGDVDYLDYLAFDIFSEDDNISGDKYNILKSIGFKTPMFRWVESFKSLDSNIKFMSTMATGYNYPTDGLVIENEDYQLAIRIGRWEEQIYSSYVEGYLESQGMYGVALEILMHPVKVRGRTCSKVAITNCANIEDNNLQIGYPIAFNLRSEANNTIDVTNTYNLQRSWEGRYEGYREMIDAKDASS